MVDNRTDGEIDESRSHQMSLLRQLCLPTLCYLLHSVLQSTENYQECMKLANVIASEQHQLFKVGVVRYTIMFFLFLDLLSTFLMSCVSSIGISLFAVLDT